MTFAKWLQDNHVSFEAAAKLLAQMSGKTCSVFAIRKWVRGERTPRPHMQATIKKMTQGAVSGDDWLPTK